MLYSDAGVNIDVLNLVRKGIGKQVAKTLKKGEISPFGLFGGIYPLGNDYLVGSVDSVGTKILVACGTGIHDTVGQDIVHHCVNDILTTGALPLFFMDYIGFSELENRIVIQVVKGIARACKRENMVLTGGETAQLTRFYPRGVYDLAGFIVGRISKRNYIDGSETRPGNIILGLKSSGLHTNGYSLARKILLREYTFASHIPELKCTIGEELLKIHRSYRHDLEPRLQYINGLAHITGGGFYDNVRRVLPRHCSAIIRKKSWKPHVIFTIIKQMGNVPDDEMYRVFNMGIGMAIIIDPENLHHFAPIKPRIIGEIVKGDCRVRLI